MTGSRAAPAGTFAVMRPRLRLMRALNRGMLALMLAFAPIAPAQAGLDDCVAAALPVGDAAKAAELAAKLSACAGQATDPVAAVVAATIVALVAAGVVPADTQQCDMVINSFIGQLVAQALIAAGAGATFGQALQDLANGTGGVTNIPGLGELLSCGCTIAGAPGEAKQIAEDYLQSVEGCGQFFLDAGEAVLNLLEDGVCLVLSPIGGCSAAGGGDPRCFMGGNIPPGGLPGYQGTAGGPLCAMSGIQCDACGGWGNCNSIPHGVGVIPGRCTCEPPYTGKYAHTTTQYSGYRESDWLYECACDPPNISANGQCFCPSHMALKNGACIPCKDNEIYSEATHTCNACVAFGLGTKPDAAHEKCIPACDAAKGEYYDGVCKQCPAGQKVAYLGLPGGLGQCEAACLPGQVFSPGIFQIGSSAKTPDSCYTCPNNTHAVYDNAGASAGKCEACADYSVSAAGSLTCTPLECGPSGYLDPDNKHACGFCPAGQIYYPEQIVSMSPGAPGIDKKVEKIPGHCACPEYKKQVGDTCQCPAGVLKDQAGCMCPAGAHVDKDSFSCQCAEGATLDPKGTKCVCPASLRIEGDKCVPVQLQKQAIPPEKSGAVAKPALQCPPRTAPNAAATACLPQLDMPDFGTPGSLPSDFGRGAPGRSPAGVAPSTAPAGVAPSTPPTRR